MNIDTEKPIRYATELAHQFAQLVRDEQEIPWIKDPNSQARLDHLQLAVDGNTISFKPYYEVSPTVHAISAARYMGPENPLLVVPKLTSHLLEVCREQKISAIDLNGRAFLRAPGLWIDRRAIPGRNFRFDFEPRNVFVGKSVRIVRSLLSELEREWTQAELVKRTQATSGLVSRIVTHLLRQGYLLPVDHRRFRLARSSAPHSGLLQAWVEADDFAHRTTTYRYAALNADPLDLARQLRNVFIHSPAAPRFAFTQWIAGWLRHPYTTPPVVSLYVSEPPAERILDQLSLNPVNEGGRIWFHVPKDTGVFLEGRQVENLPLVSDAQIYVDLIHAGLRGPDQANALRNWEGFSLP